MERRRYIVTPMIENTKPMKLSNQSLQASAVADHVQVPQYDRTQTGIGIVHFGPGAFHRAHQAVYTEDAMSQFGGNWGICGVSLRSSSARDTLAEQDFLYTLATLDRVKKLQVIGAMKEILVSKDQTPDIFDRLVSQDTKLVSLTITEKGYCLNAEGRLDLNHDDIKHDLANPTTPVSAVGFIAIGLVKRFKASVPAFNVLSCDNVADNGTKLRQAVLDFIEQYAPEALAWATDSVAFPNSMVDSITPKTEDYTVEEVSGQLNVTDQWPIQREAFTQWVIEDNWQGERPAWDKVGVVFTNDVHGFEKAKLRLLNCLHSTLAYAGRLADFETVYEVTSDKSFSQFIRKLAQQEVIGSFEAPSELNVEEYSEQIIERFLNPEIRHLLAQIAWDGSQKLQMRLVPIIKDNVALGRDTALLSTGLVAWFEFIRRAVKAEQEIVDPLASTFTSTPAIVSDDLAEAVDAFLSIESVFDDEFRALSGVRKQLIDGLTKLSTLNADEIGPYLETL